MEINVNPSYENAWFDQHRYHHVYGGGGSGKSVYVSQKVVSRCWSEGNHHFLILRKVQKTVRKSCYREIIKRLNEMNIPYIEKKSDYEIHFKNPKGENNVLYFSGVDDPEKIKSIEGITGIWMEELTEFTLEDFMQIDLRLRGITKNYKQILMSYNPDETKGYWIKELFHDGSTYADQTFILNTTADDNDYIDEEYKGILDKLINTDETYYKIFRLGQWASLKGIIYDPFHIIPEQDYPIEPEEVIYAMDFAYTVQSAVLEIRVKNEKVYLKELLYETHLTNSELIERVGQLIPERYKNSIIYADGAEPQRIEEFRQAGFNCVSADKSPGSVKSGIDFVKSNWDKIYSLKGNDNLHKERATYKWLENKDGKKAKDEPVKFRDHLMDCMRGGLYTHFKNVWMTVVFNRDNKAKAYTGSTMTAGF